MIRITRAGPLCTLQDEGRFGMLAHGVSASGPMDRGAFRAAGALLERAGSTAIEFTAAGLALEAADALQVGLAGGVFNVTVNGKPMPWPGAAKLKRGDVLDITPGPAGNYGYFRFDREVAILPVMGSRSTNLTVGLGGLEGRALRAGDQIALAGPGSGTVAEPPNVSAGGTVRVTWGLHADLFTSKVREAFMDQPFVISTKLDRMGARLDDTTGVFADIRSLSLVSDAIVAGDIQILGDGTPIVLLRDHQPTGGYPRIATVISADLDRFVQMRPGTEVRFTPVTVAKAQGLLR
ncbi:MAG TPA: biotin-dependent carboxyltransferase family protein [Devosia sp.]